MKYAFFNKGLLNQNLKPMSVTEDPASGPWTAKDALAAAVLVDNQANATTKLKRYELFMKLNSHEDPTPESTGTDYSTEEVALLKEAALTYPTIFAGQLSYILDQK